MLILICSAVVAMTAAGQGVLVSSNPVKGSRFTNPIINADYSDPDVVASPDGRTFYMTASSFQCVPGLPILKSSDLVNWELIGYALDSVPPADYYGSGIPRHGKGVWAPCFRYHDGMYYIFWGDPDFGIFMVNTPNPEGDWSSPVLVRPGKGLIDPTPFWDIDGKAYLANGWAASRSGFNSIVTISEMAPDGTRLIGAPRIVYDGNDGVNHTVEGPKMYRRGEYYYLFAPAGGVADGWQLVMRSKNIFGPYESKIVMVQGDTDINGPHQGAWVTGADGSDWFVHFQDRGPFGRVIHLNPLAWVNDWPVIGVDHDGDGIGSPVREYSRPTSYGIPGPTDNIASLFQWHSNYSDFFGFPMPDALMRIYSHKLSADSKNLWEVPNLWLMKFPSDNFTFTADVAISAKEGCNGVSSGIIVMGWDYCRVGLTEQGDDFVLRMVQCTDAEQGGNEIVHDIAVIRPDRIYEAGLHKNLEKNIRLRVTVDNQARCRFAYSLDDGVYINIPYTFTARAGKWIGAKVGFYSIAPSTVADRGWLDVKNIKIDD